MKCPPDKGKHARVVYFLRRGGTLGICFRGWGGENMVVVVVVVVVVAAAMLANRLLHFIGSMTRLQSSRYP